MIMEEEEAKNFMDIIELKERVFIHVRHLGSENKDFESVVTLATNFSIEKSISPNFLLGICSSYTSNGSYDLAYVFAKAAANLSTGDTKATAHYNAGIISYLMGHKEEAERQYKLALETNPKDAEAYTNYGFILAEMGRNGEAEKQYKLALEINPKNAVAHCNYGTLLQEMGRQEEAEKQYELALEADPKNINAHYNYGILLSEMKRKEEAEKFYKLTLELDPKNIAAYMSYSVILAEMDRKKEAEEQYKLALEVDPKNVTVHYNYGTFLIELGRGEEAEEQYKLALETDPENVNTNYNYAILLTEMGRREEAGEHYKLVLKGEHKHLNMLHNNYGAVLEEVERWKEAEEQYKLALELDTKNAKIHLNYGILLTKIGRWREAEEQYKLALEADSNDADIHHGYGVLLTEIGRWKEAEDQYKFAIKLNPKGPIIHSAYGLHLFYMNLEARAIEEMKIASSLFRENGDKVKEHLSFAWLYEEFANKYYDLEDYETSGKYAEISGNEYIEAGKHAEEKFKITSLTKGYTLKGRAKIRRLEIKTPFYKDIFKRIWNKGAYEIEKFTKIIDCIMDASRCYEKAAKASPKDNQLCNACSLSMSCLSEMLDYMLAVIKQEKTPQLEDKLKNWNEKLSIAKNAYKAHSKGDLFIESLYKLMGCIQNLDKYKKHGTREYGRAFDECRKELSEIANNIEGPLQKIIEDSAKRMDVCRLKIMPYAGTETGYIPQPSKLSRTFKWIVKNQKTLSIEIIVAVISGIIMKKYFP